MLVYKSLSPSVEFSISLFPVFIQHADVLDLLIGFFLTLFDSLKSQVSEVYMERGAQREGERREREGEFVREMLGG